MLNKERLEVIFLLASWYKGSLATSVGVAEFIFTKMVIGLTKSQNQTMVKVGRGLWRPSGPTPA